MAVFALDGCNDTFRVQMSANDPIPEESQPRWRSHRLGVLLLLLACLVGLGVYLLAAGEGSGGGGSKSAADCGGGGAPAVGRVSASALGALRGSVLRVLPERVGKLYEEGTVMGSYMWSDAQPAPPPVSAKALRPAGYEMRWFAPDGDDIAADVLVFSDARV